jgi:hypothetical protein
MFVSVLLDDRRDSSAVRVELLSVTIRCARHVSDFPQRGESAYQPVEGCCWVADGDRELVAKQFFLGGFG